MTSDDMALVREYAQSHCEQAFAALVSRHVNLVHSVARRHVPDLQLSEDITCSFCVESHGKARMFPGKRA